MRPPSLLFNRIVDSYLNNLFFKLKNKSTFE